MYILKPAVQLAVLHLLIEGNSIRSTERLTGVHRDSICRLLVHAGTLAGLFLDRILRGLKVLHVECDEIWTFVLIKQAHIEPDVNDAEIGDQYVFTALDRDTKLLVSHLVGKRTTPNAEAFMLDIAGRVKAPKPGEPKIRLQISTDGFAAYPGAVDLAFAQTADYGVIIKSFKEDEEAPGRYGPPEVTGTERRVITGKIEPESICTSHVERNNLTIRTFVRRFTRLSLGFSKRLRNLIAAVNLHAAHYNLCRVHRTLRMTPAMAAGVSRELWSLERLAEEMGL